MTQAQKNGNNEERKILKERMLIKDNMGLSFIGCLELKRRRCYNVCLEKSNSELYYTGRTNK